MFITSDTHFDHTNIIKYSKRPYGDVEKMNEGLINKWNSKVGKNDVIYHLGDFCFSNRSKYFLSRLNGKKHLILGNHDKQVHVSNGWESIQHYAEVYTQVNGQKQMIVLCHYAMRVWNKSHRGTWMLYGHSHGNLADDANLLSFDAGVDCHNYTPLHVNDVERIMRKKTYQPVDHHGQKD